MSNRGSLVTESNTPQFVDVMVPVHVSQKFTYKLPESMRSLAQIGSRVLVPLGHTVTPGYIIELRPRLRAGTSLDESQIKPVRELLDIEPPLTPEVVELTRWVADYYAA